MAEDSVGINFDPSSESAQSTGKSIIAEAALAPLTPFGGILFQDIKVPKSIGRAGGAAEQFSADYGDRQSTIDSILSQWQSGMDEAGSHLRSAGSMVKASQDQRKAAMQAAALHAAQTRARLAKDDRASMGSRGAGMSIGQALASGARRREGLADIRRNQLETDATVAEIAKQIAQAKADEGTAQAALDSWMFGDPFKAAESDALKQFAAQWEAGGPSLENANRLVHMAVDHGSPAVIEYVRGLLVGINPAREIGKRKRNRMIAFLDQIPRDAATNQWVAAHEAWKNQNVHYTGTGRAYRPGKRSTG